MCPIDDVARRSLSTDNVAERQVVGEERNAAQLEQVISDALRPQLFDVVSLADALNAGRALTRSRCWPALSGRRPCRWSPA